MTSPTNITQYCTVRSWYIRKRIDHWCSVVSRKILTLGSTVQWETRQASFPTGTVGPRVRIFLSPLNTNDGFYLSHTPRTQPLYWFPSLIKLYFRYAYKLLKGENQSIPTRGKDKKTNSCTSAASRFVTSL